MPPIDTSIHTSSYTRLARGQILSPDGIFVFPCRFPVGNPRRGAADALDAPATFRRPSPRAPPPFLAAPFFCFLLIRSFRAAKPRAAKPRTEAREARADASFFCPALEKLERGAASSQVTLPVCSRRSRIFRRKSGRKSEGVGVSCFRDALSRMRRTNREVYGIFSFEVCAAGLRNLLCDVQLPA